MVSTAMTSFLPVNTALTMTETIDHRKGRTTPSTPHIATSMKPLAQEQNRSSINGSTVGARDNNSGTGNGAKQINANLPFPNMASTTGGHTASREGSSTQSSAPDEIPAAESEGEQHYHSDNEVDMSGTAPPSKRKKGQRFFCTDYPPCNLSFTRSEHLARHIRKHTGERPFQCHCSRRFSRLDNLRQHAQTVHVNEDIPGDSLAATGTRFQRQIRTDRVRPPGRARAGTGGSQGGHARGHSRNLSTSSVASNVSSYSQSQEFRRRPPPLMMASDATARARMSLDTMASAPKTPPGQIHAFSGQSPAIYTPSSATYPSGGVGDMGSPYYASPASATSAFWPDRMSGRRLSVPSGSRPFESPHVGSYPPTYSTKAIPSNSPYPGTENSFGNPSGSHTPVETPGLSPSEADLRRRTWHPSSQTGFARPVTSGLWYQQSARTPQPTFGSNMQPPQNQPTRLPGIESFDQVQQRPSVPPRREPSPMAIDRPTEPAPASSKPTMGSAFPPSFSSHTPATRPPPPFPGATHRRGNLSLDTTLQRTLTKLDIQGGGSHKDAAQWSQQTLGELQSVGSRPSTSSSFPQAPTQPDDTSGRKGSSIPEEHTVPPSPQQGKGYRWYNAPVGSSSPGQEQITQPSSTRPGNTESTTAISNPTPAYHPTMTQSENHPGNQPSQQSAADPANTSPQNNVYSFSGNTEGRPGFYSGSANQNSGMGRLEALVAVATSEDKNKLF